MPEGSYRTLMRVVHVPPSVPRAARMSHRRRLCSALCCTPRHPADSRCSFGKPISGIELLGAFSRAWRITEQRRPDLPSVAPLGGSVVKPFGSSSTVTEEYTGGSLM